MGTRLRPTAATEGFGPLLQRDYWAVIADCRIRPEALISVVARRFPQLSPAHLCYFSRERRRRSVRPTVQSLRRPLGVGDVLHIRIALAVACRVRVVHADAQSLTLATLPGHPEAGRITFGAYQDEKGRVVFQIRSRARSSTAVHYVGFRALGKALQTQTWTEFVTRVAASYGNGLATVVHAKTSQVTEDAHEQDCFAGGRSPESPVLLARRS